MDDDSWIIIQRKDYQCPIYDIPPTAEEKDLLVLIDQLMLEGNRLLHTRAPSDDWTAQMLDIGYSLEETLKFHYIGKEVLRAVRERNRLDLNLPFRSIAEYLEFKSSLELYLNWTSSFLVVLQELRRMTPAEFDFYPYDDRLIVLHGFRSFDVRRQRQEILETLMNSYWQ